MPIGLHHDCMSVDSVHFILYSLPIFIDTYSLPNFTDAYSFIYSPRPGTPATLEKDDISMEIYNSYVNFKNKISPWTKISNLSYLKTR